MIFKNFEIYADGVYQPRIVIVEAAGIAAATIVTILETDDWIRGRINMANLGK